MTEEARRNPTPRVHVVGEGPPGTTWAAACARLGPARAERLMASLAITGAVGRRLAGLLDEPWPEGLVAWRHPGRERYALHNLQDVPWAERPFDGARMRARAAELLAAARQEGAPLLLLGRKVAEAFRLADDAPERGPSLRRSQGAQAPFCSWSRLEAGELVGLLPHPSRRSTWWNERENAEEAVAFLRSARWALDRGCAEDEPGSWGYAAHPLEVAGAGAIYASRREAVEEGWRAHPARARLWTARVLVDVAGEVPARRSTWLSRHER